MIWKKAEGISLKDITISEAYFLCAVKEKGRILGCDTKRVICLLTAVLAELETAGSVALSQRGLKLLQKPPESPTYLRVLYEHLRELDTPTLELLLKEYHNALSDRCLNALSSAIGDPLTDRHLATAAKLGVLNSRRFYVPHANTLPALMAEYLVDVQYSHPVRMEDGLLWLLLNRSSCVPAVLTRQDQDIIHRKISSALRNGELPSLQRLGAYVDLQLSIAKHTSLILD